MPLSMPGIMCMGIPRPPFHAGDEIHPAASEGAGIIAMILGLKHAPRTPSWMLQYFLSDDMTIDIYDHAWFLNVVVRLFIIILTAWLFILIY